MANDTHMIFEAKNINDVLYQIKTVNNLQIIGGATYIGELPEKSLTIRNVSELNFMNKHERYIDFGPGVTLNNILHVGPNYLPTVLYEAVQSVSNHAIRNMATLGGNIMAKDSHLSLVAPLIALNTTLKFKTQKSFEIIPLSKLAETPPESVLTGIRVPTEDWNVAIFRRLGPSFKLSPNSASFCFLADTEKNVLVNLRLCFSGPFIFQSQTLETKYLGTRLPLNKSIIEDFLSIAKKEFEECGKDKIYNSMLKQQFLNLIAYSLHELT
ncbi:MAG: FAD binding domain-containing protein [Treponema sp.]|uniref:FAD binding domain-containing protein n=1 Tax=Treponema sp. TaxID=166 RepID=UPI001B5521F3|nr:FAD binding domain-containing protein [Treponema sp.]MBP5403098.1 FAD binding domain-containing protein [Treponema sp.]MBR5934317.1 FAD binding domain-containing protein [Treponema sp.]